MAFVGEKPNMALSQKKILSDPQSTMNVFFLKTWDFWTDQFSAILSFQLYK